ncbi:MAG TPA: ABC transporter permease [Candidatus Acidoferrum sp.]|nr:ABC transporter permease [Candidatus Acidoferrum sp.]
MRLWTRVRSWSRAILDRSRAESEMDAELRFHIDAYAEDLIRSGLPRAEALRRARVEFGGVESAKEECREALGVRFIEALVQDLRYGFRTLRKSPGFAAVAIFTLALGIGANTAIFSVVYAVVLKPLPFANPGQLIFLSEAKPQQGIPSAGISYDNFTEIRAQNHVFSELAAAQNHQLTLTGHGDPAAVDTADVMPELFALLDVKPVLGRTFVSEDGKQGAQPVAILSENFWRDRFAADPNVIGSSVSLDHRSFTVVGVVPAAPATLFSPTPIQFWIPLAQDPLFGPWIPRQGLRWLGIVGRLKPGVSIAQAQAEMDAISARLAAKFPAENTGWTIRLKPLQQVIVGDVRTALLVLLGAVGLILLIACANISNLLLARATSRGKEMALRIALGAGRSRIIRQLLTESAALGLLGGAAGVLLAYWGVHALISFLPSSLPKINDVRVDASVLAFALLLSVLASLVFGLAPAFFAAGSRVQSNLQESGGRAGEARARRFARSFLAVAEVTLAMILLVGAGLLVRSFLTLTSVSPGFDARNVVRAEISLPQFQYSKPEQWTAFSDELLRRLQAQPGMRDSAIGLPLPLDAQGAATLGFEIAGHPPLPKGTPETADYVSISPEYFHVMSIPLLRGRTFDDQDIRSAPMVTIISEALAHRYFPDQDPLGKQLIFSFPPNPGIPRQIVGVVGDVRDVSLGRDPGPMMYVPFAQAPLWGAEVVVRSNLSPESVSATIRHEVRQVDKDLPVTNIGSMAGSLDTSVQQPRFRTWLLGLFAAIALVLAAAGIFGVISYSVGRRTHEIGIRITLGATPADVLRLILGESARLVLVGLAVGIPAALGLARLLSNLLFAIRPADPLTLAAVSLLLLAVATVAAYIPARRAMRVDPMVALRHE